MSRRWIAAALCGCLLLPIAVAAQQPARPRARLASITSSDENVATALDRALVEFTNFGWVRADRQLDPMLAAQPDAGLLRALRFFNALDLPVAQRRAELDRAVQDAARASTPELVLVTAMREQLAGRNAPALALIDVAAKLLPDEPVVEFLRINFLTTDEAKLAAAEAAHERFPTHPGIMNHLAYEEYRAGFCDEGLAHAKQYVDLLPDHPNAHDTYAELLHMHGDLAAAEAEYRRAMELDPTWFNARIGLAELALSRGDVRAARSEMEAVIPVTREPMERIVALRNAAWAAALTHDAAAMRRHIAQAVTLAEAAKLTATVRDLHGHLALAEAALGNAPQSEAAFQALSKFTPVGVYQGYMRTLAAALRNDEVGMREGVAEMQAAAKAGNDAPALVEAVTVARSVQASTAGDFTTARAELAKVTTPALRAIGSAYLARGLQKQGDLAGAAQARSSVAAYTVFDANRAFALMIQGK